MKRERDVLSRIAEMENLQLAYLKARRGKAAKEDVYLYGKSIDENLKRMQQELLSGSIQAGNYRSFKIYDPKERQISAAPFHQRVMHHALMNVCHRRFENAQIHDSYASRIGKGAYAALNKARLNCVKYAWFLKLDVRKYFDSIDHDILKKQLHGLFKDRRLLSILDRIIDSRHVEMNKGVPIGNLTSQYFANHYLAGADHYVKEVLRIPGYVRYMDDMVLWHTDKDKLKTAGSMFQKYLEGCLLLQLNPWCLNSSSKGLPFLGYLAYRGKARLAHRSRKRFIDKLRIYDRKLSSLEWSQKEYQNHVLPLIAFAEHADTLGFRKKIIMDMQ
jgi:RNA-directed DNA polymerase